MYNKETLNRLKKGCFILNKLFKKTLFFEKLCNYSNNDITLVIKNISLIINYYITTNDQNIDYDLRMLFQKISEIASFTHDYLIHPSSLIKKLDLTIFGIDPISYYNTHKQDELERLDELVSFFPYSSNVYSTEIFDDVYDSLTAAFQTPKILHQSILKQPKGKEQPYIVGETEQEYYSSILSIRLKNIDEALAKTGATLAKRVFNDYIGKDNLLVLFPKKNLSKNDIKSKKTLARIPPIYLSYITIPSYYKLLSICIKNQKLKEGTPLSILDGKNYQITLEPYKQHSSFSYSRFEPISITEDFIYANQEFTQDINYDIDLIYGKYDSNKSRYVSTRHFSEDMENIRYKTDVIVRKQDGKYEIRNGRHRILYIKHFYLSNYQFFKETNSLDTLKRLTTIPMHVERTLEDEKMDKDLCRLEFADQTARFYKIDTNNDIPELLIVFLNRIYKINNREELHQLTEKLLHGEYINDFFLIENDETKKFDYRKITEDLILKIREKIYEMNLLDILAYLIIHGFTIDDTHYQPTNLNISYLYHEYCDLQAKIQLSKVTGRPLDLVGEVENNLKLEEIGLYIMEILDENPDYIALNWDNLFEILHLYPKLSPYTDEFLQEAANTCGYQRLKLHHMYENKHCTKKTKL